MLRIWTRSQRRLLQRLIASSEVDEHQVVEATKRLALGWADVLPTNWKGIDLLPLVLHKIAGYNVGLHGRVRSVLATLEGVKIYLDGCQSPWIISPLRSFPLRTYVFRERVRKLDGHFWHVWGEWRADACLRSQIRARCDDPNYIPLEVPLLDMTPNELLALPNVQTSVLFMASMNNYLNPMIPIMERLTESGCNVVVLLPRFSAQWKNYARLPKEVQRLFIEDLLTPEIYDIYQRERSRYQQLWEERQEDLVDAFALEGVCLWPFIRRDMKNIVVNYLPHCVAYIEMAQMLVARLGTRVAVCARLRRAVENSFFASFRQSGVFTTMLIHGHISDQPGRYFDDGYFAPLDVVCVWGEDQRRKLLNKEDGVRPEQITVTGNPAWDRLALERSRFGDKIGLRQELAPILSQESSGFWVTLTTEDENTKCQYEAIQQAVLRVPEAVLFVKVHPGERPDWYYEHRLTGADERIRIVPHGKVDLHPLLAASHVVLTFSSTTNLEALLVGTPVITVAIAPSLTKRDRLVHLEAYGLPFATTEDKLARALETVRDSDQAFQEETREAVERALDELVIKHRDGAATDRVVHLITERL